MNQTWILNRDETYIQSLIEEYTQKKRIKITPLMEDGYVDLLYKFGITQKRWMFASGIQHMKYEKEEIPQNEKINRNQMKQVQTAFQKNQFSYAFYRCMNNNKPSFLEFQLRQFMNSQDLMEYLNQITGLQLTKLTTLFMSKYVSGNFLSPHSDKGNGRLAFVIGLTKGWKPWFGGNLHFLDDKREEIVETYSPDFNSMILFEIPEGKGIPHFVSHVHPSVPIPRLAITGWFE